MNLERLKDPFPEQDLEWRVQSAGKTGDKVWARVLTYITNRAIMDRLDEVVGAGNWRNEFKEWMKDSILCGISINIDGTWVTKWDGADGTDIEATKGGLSGAMKRAGVQWGIGRYLYNLDAEYAIISDKGKHYQAGKDGKYPAFKWDAPKLPAWALPDGNKTAEPRDVEQKYLDQLFSECKTQDDLKTLWMSLNKDQQKEFKDLKDQIKTKLEG